MNAIAVIILESKAFVPALADKAVQNQHFVRWNEKVDNPIVAESLIKALENLNFPYMADETAFERNDSLELETKRIGKYIAELGDKYAQAKTSAQKVKIAAELSKVVAQDMGGSIFMSNALFKVVAGGGLWPGQSAVFSILSSKADIDENHTIITEEKELQNSISVILYALNYLHENQNEAQNFVHERDPKLSPDDLLRLAEGI